MAFKVDLSGILGQVKGLLGGESGVKQILYWQVFAQLLGPLLDPLLREEQQATNARFTNVPLGVADLVDAVVKGHMDEKSAADQAALSGISAERFHTLVDGAGEPPGPQTLVEALNRGIIVLGASGGKGTSFEEGIRESRVKDKWIPVLEQLGRHLLDPAVVVDAWVEGQISEQDARRLLSQNGIGDDDATTLYNSRGNPPSPSDLAVLLRKRLIPRDGVGPDVVSFQQGIYEGSTRNKWWTYFAALSDYIPPPRTITTLIHNGTITDDEALKLFQDNGLSAELAGIYVADAHHTKVAAQRDLAVGSVEQLYHDRIIDAKTATGMLSGLGYSPEDSAFILELQDFKVQQETVAKAITKLASLYIAHKLSKGNAGTALDALEVPPAQRDQLIAGWDLERAANVKVLTAAEVASAFKNQLIAEGDALQLLAAQGYPPFDAWVVLADAIKGPLSSPQPPLTLPGV